LKEEIKDKELSECTFKPKIMSNYEINREEEVFDEPRLKRFNQLYKMGIQIVSNKKDRQREEIDIEIHGKDCTFKPNIDKPETKEIKAVNDIYNEKSYEKQYNRLKNGRMVIGIF
jgi:hypothetical protein